MLDVWGQDLWRDREMLVAINKPKMTPRQIMSTGLYTPKRVTQDLVAVELKDGQIALLPELSRHGVPTEYAETKGRSVGLQITARKQRATIHADQVLGRREFGTSGATPMSIESLRDEYLTDIRANHDATREHRQAHGIVGQYVDSDGTVIYNYFTLLGVAVPSTVFLDLSVSTGGVLMQKLDDARRAIELSLGTVVPTGYKIWTGPDFWAALFKNPEVRASFNFVDVAAFYRESNLWRTFTWGNYSFEEYRVGNSGITSFIAADQAIMVPLGVPNLFIEAIAPAPWLDTVNTLGLPYYAKTAVDPKYQEYIEIETQSHTLAINTRPDAIRILDKDAS